MKEVFWRNSFLKKSEDSFTANKILKCLMCESLLCSLDFLRRQHMVFVTHPPVSTAAILRGTLFLSSNVKNVR